MPCDTSFYVVMYVVTQCAPTETVQQAMVHVVTLVCLLPTQHEKSDDFYATEAFIDRSQAQAQVSDQISQVSDPIAQESLDE